MNQQDAQIRTNNLYFTVSACSTCFGRTTRPSSGALPSKLYHSSYSTNVPTLWYSLLGSAPDDGRVVRPKHVEQAKTVK